MEVISATEALSKSITATLKDFYPTEPLAQVCFQNELYGLLKVIEFIAEGHGTLDASGIVRVGDEGFNIACSLGIQLGFLHRPEFDGYGLLTGRLGSGFKEGLEELAMSQDLAAVDRLEEEIFQLVDSCEMAYIKAALDDGSLPADSLAAAEALLVKPAVQRRCSAYRSKTLRHAKPAVPPKRRGFGRTLRRKKGSTLVANK